MEKRLESKFNDEILWNDRKSHVTTIHVICHYILTESIALYFPPIVSSQYRKVYKLNYVCYFKFIQFRQIAQKQKMDATQDSWNVMCGTNGVFVSFEWISIIILLFTWNGLRSHSYMKKVFCDMTTIMISLFPDETILAYYYYGSFYSLASNEHLFFHGLLSLHWNENPLGWRMLSIVRISIRRKCIVVLSLNHSESFQPRIKPQIEDVDFL